MKQKISFYTTRILLFFRQLTTIFGALMKQIFFFIVCCSFVLAQGVGGQFFENSKRDITYGQWLDYSNTTGTIFVAEGDSGLRAYQQSGGFGGPINLTGIFNSAGSIYCVDVTGNYAYLAAGMAGLQVVDVSNPAAMTLTGSAANANLRVLLHEGDYVYAGSLTDLYIYNVSNPSSVSLLGTVTLPGDPKRFVLRGDWLYAALGSSGGGLLPINVSNPAEPAAGTLITYQGFVYDVMKEEDEAHSVLYVAEGVRYHKYDIFASTGIPAPIRSDSVGGKLSRLVHCGAVIGKDGQHIRVYDNDRIVTSLYTPGGSEFIYSPGSEQLIYCGDSLYTGGFLFSDVDEKQIPEKFEVSEAFPNPFNPSATLTVTLKERIRFSVDIYNSAGELMYTVNEEEREAGVYPLEIRLNGFSSGVYYAQFKTKDLTGNYSGGIIRKLTLLK